jgi:gliding motility-associated-like protein
MHAIHVLDNNNCPIDTNINITEPAPLYFTGANITNPTCEGYTDGSVQVGATGGTTPYQYAYGNGAFASADMFTTLAEGTYVFYVSDANGCLHDTTITLTGYPHIVLGDNIITPAKCYGSADGAVEVIATGGMQPFVYALGSGASSPSNTFTGLYSGNYEVTITDDKNCSKQAPVYVPQPDSLSIHMAVTPNDCRGLDENGAIVAEVTGGTTPYTYLWSFGDAATQAISKLPNGDYSVTVTDSNNCTSTATAIVEYDNCCNPFLPNAFTPNGDGKNDIFRVVFKGDMDLLEFSVYNRFGQRVYTSSDITHGWDGNFNNTKADMGTYMYYIRFICGNKSTEKQILKGDVTLIR